MPGLPSDIKIAVCISGETRTWNTLTDPEKRSHAYQLEMFLQRMKDILKCDIDVYGHTWDHCDIPQETNFFKHDNLTISNQDFILGNWLREDIFNRLIVYDMNITEIPTEHKSFLGKDPHAFLESFVHSGKKAWGQYFSHQLCVESIPNIMEYDYIIRWRWDLALELPSDVPRIPGKPAWDENMDVLIEYAIQQIGVFMTPDSDVHPVPSVLCGCNSFTLSDGYSQLEDVFFVFKRTNNLVMRTKDGFWREDAAQMNEMTHQKFRIDAHGLWGNIFRFYKLVIWQTLPNIFLLSRDPNHMGAKEN